jgi:hypothetical protein
MAVEDTARRDAGAGRPPGAAILGRGMTDPAHFPPDYAEGRRRFLAAAEARGAALSAHAVPAPGPHGEELAIDVAYLGPEAPARVLAVSSGVHGAEGFAGSAIQRQLLAEQLDGLELPRDAGLLLVHAVNPYGFAAVRRVNESNVDLNRNFLRHPDEHEPNPDYDALYLHVNPERLDEESDAASRAALLAFAQREGFPRLQAVLTRGQYAHPRGMQYGGAREEASNVALRAIARSETRGARRVAWIDVHTGLGSYGEVEMISELPPGDPGLLRARAFWGGVVKTTASGESVSAAVCGSIDRGLPQELPGCELTLGCAEIGTVDPVRAFWAMRADNWLHVHGDPDSAQGRAIRAGLLAAFRPDDPAWMRRVLELGARLVRQARDGLAAA